MLSPTGFFTPQHTHFILFPLGHLGYLYGLSTGCGPTDLNIKSRSEQLPQALPGDADAV